MNIVDVEARTSSRPNISLYDSISLNHKGKLPVLSVLMCTHIQYTYIYLYLPFTMWPCHCTVSNLSPCFWTVKSQLGLSGTEVLHATVSSWVERGTAEAATPLFISSSPTCPPLLCLILAVAAAARFWELNSGCGIWSCFRNTCLFVICGCILGWVGFGLPESWASLLVRSHGAWKVWGGMTVEVVLLCLWKVWINGYLVCWVVWLFPVALLEGVL